MTVLYSSERFPARILDNLSAGAMGLRWRPRRAPIPTSHDIEKEHQSRPGFRRQHVPEGSPLRRVSVLRYNDGSLGRIRLLHWSSATAFFPAAARSIVRGWYVDIVNFCRISLGEARAVSLHQGSLCDDLLFDERQCLTPGVYSGPRGPRFRGTNAATPPLSKLALF